MSWLTLALGFRVLYVAGGQQLLDGSVMFKKNIAVTGFPFMLLSATTGLPVTSGVAVGYVVLDGGSQAALGSSPVHEGNGQWSVNLTAAEMNGDVVGLVFIHPDAIPVSFTIKTDAEITAIKTKTDALPADPADESNIQASIAAIASLIAALNNLSSAQVATVVAAYDAPTYAEAVILTNSILSVIAALNNISTAQVSEALATYDSPTYAEMVAQIDALFLTLLGGDISEIEDTAAVHSLYTAILKHVSKVADNGEGKIITYQLDGVTPHMEQPVTVDADLLPLEAIGVGL